MKVIVIQCSDKDKWLDNWKAAHFANNAVDGEKLITMMLGIKGFRGRRVIIYNKFGKENMVIEVLEYDNSKKTN